MNIITKYNLGDEVYYIRRKQETIKVPTNCTLCNDTGEVIINDKSYTCPECNGHTYHIEEGNIKYYVSISQGTIGKINVDLYDNSKYEEKSKIGYMLDLTGVGSGVIWKEDELFYSIEEAQIECDKRNTEMKDED